MRTLLVTVALLVLPLIGQGQQLVRYSKQNGKLLSPYVEGKPVVGMAFYSGRICAGDSQFILDPQSVLFAAQDFVQVQDSELAINAATRVKTQSRPAKFWKWTVLLGRGALAGYGVYSSFNHGSSGFSVWAPRIANGVSLGLPALEHHNTEAQTFKPPTNWVSSGAPKIAVDPGECAAVVFLANDGADHFETRIGASLKSTVAPAPTPTAPPAIDPRLIIPLQSRTHPEDKGYTPERIAEMVREHSAEIGAGN